LQSPAIWPRRDRYRPPRQNLERDLDRLSGLDVARIDLRDRHSEDRCRRIDKRHHRRLRGDARSLAQRQIGDVSVGRRPHRGLVEIPLRAVELRLELVHFRFALLHVEGTAGIGAL
jgi:hypothetical protein